MRYLSVLCLALVALTLSPAAAEAHFPLVPGLRPGFAFRPGFGLRPGFAFRPGFGQPRIVIAGQGYAGVPLGLRGYQAGLTGYSGAAGVSSYSGAAGFGIYSGDALGAASYQPSLLQPPQLTGCPQLLGAPAPTCAHLSRLRLLQSLRGY